MKRPISGAVIAWLLIMSSILSLMAALVLIDNPIVMELMPKLMAKSSVPIPQPQTEGHTGRLIAP